VLRFVVFLRKPALRVTVTVLFASTAAVSAAEPLLGNDIAWPGLTQDDINRMHAAAARLYEGRSIGTVERWRSPDSKDAGEVKLIQSFNSHGMPCSTIDYVIRFDTERDNPDHYVINWCKVQGGEWKIVELAEPR
jgi:hypothetical protein